MFVAFTVDQFKALDDKLTELAQGGGGSIADGSVTTAKLADGAVTASKMDGTFLSSIYDYADTSSEAVILATDATAAQVLSTYGIAAAIVAPDDFDVSDANLTELVKPQTRLCWINGTDLEIAGVHIDGDMVGQTITMVAKGNTSTISGVLGVDTAWTVTANSSGGGSQTTWYGTCSTSASTTTKVITCQGFTLTDGAMITVHFETASSKNTPTFNVNNTGSVGVGVRGIATTSSNPLRWSANSMLTFVYSAADNKFYAIDSPSTYSFVCSSAATAQNKAPANARITLMNDTVAYVRFTNGNTYEGELRLNIGSIHDDVITTINGDTSATNTLLLNPNDTLVLTSTGNKWLVLDKIPATA